MDRRGSSFQYNGRYYSSMTEMVHKILQHKKITNVRDVFVCNMGFMKGNSFTRTRVRTAESILPFIDSRYRSFAINMEEYESKSNGVYRCGETITKNLEVVLRLSQVSKCHIRINAPSIEAARKPCIVKPIVPPKRFSGQMNLILHPLLKDLAQRHADSMANHQKSRYDVEQKLISDQNKKYDELIAYTSRGYSKFLMYILFNDAWNHNPNFDRLSAKKWEMARLMSRETKYVGIGISRRHDAIYVCVKFTPFSLHAE
uniref:SCP domain-containing protein n=1 Tax=Strongyloides papillosus TaxID=174720 RepID=A0A0N5C303_STREA